VREVEVAIVGGGPAGLTAALEAAQAGAQVVLIDELSTPGGQFYKQVPDAFRLKKLQAEGRIQSHPSSSSLSRRNAQ